jgi:hypothetical protein
VKPARRDVGIIAGVLLHVHARVHRSFTMNGAASHQPKIAPANQRRRFAQKTGFGERR